MLILPDGRSYYTKSTGGEIMTTDPGIVIELIPEIGNRCAPSKLYVSNDDAESAKRLAFLNKGNKP
jgi:hypothetical protein